ncbi:MAG: type I CRISPR-associated protein Cas7 [Dehalobacterium sp.]|jgi:CRISPR-associated protein Csh2
MLEEKKSLSGRREFLFLYDIKMGSPNGDTDENRPRVLPDGTYYVTDVRLKRFSRDFLKSRGFDILVDSIEGRTTNLTGRVVHYLAQMKQDKAEGKELVKILLDSFIDARLYGSSLAFKAEKFQDEKGKEKNWEPKPEPKTLTGAVQINMGEVLHQAESVDIIGTSVFSSDERKSQGTFTSYYGLRYALIGFSGVANEHSARLSQMSDEDYELMLQSLWHGVRSAGNTRTKVGQVPRFILSIDYLPGEEFQFGRLHDYVKMEATSGKSEKEWAFPDDYLLDLEKLMERIEGQKERISSVRYAQSPDINTTKPLPSNWKKLEIEDLPKG